MPATGPFNFHNLEIGNIILKLQVIQKWERLTGFPNFTMLEQKKSPEVRPDFHTDGAPNPTHDISSHITQWTVDAHNLKISASSYFGLTCYSCSH